MENSLKSSLTVYHEHRGYTDNIIVLWDSSEALWENFGALGPAGTVCHHLVSDMKSESANVTKWKRLILLLLL